MADHDCRFDGELRCEECRAPHPRHGDRMDLAAVDVHEVQSLVAAILRTAVEDARALVVRVNPAARDDHRKNQLAHRNAVERDRASALRFLRDPDSRLGVFAAAIGLDAEAIREAAERF